MTVSSASSESVVERLILPSVRDLGDGFKVRRALPSAQRRMVGPFIFLDQFGPTVFDAGEAPNVRPHPHIGLSTLTYLMTGEIVHRDSTGAVASVLAGDVNWMTAGSGIVHSERPPARSQSQSSSLFGQQIWIALPKSREEMSPGFSNHSQRSLPRIEDNGVSLKVVAGTAFGQRSPVPVYSDLMYVDVTLQAGAKFQIPPEHIERGIYVVEGDIEIAGQTGSFDENRLLILKPEAEVVITARRDSRVTLVGGEPFPETRYIYWNFVSSSQDRIEQAKDDWRRGRFPEVAGETEFIPLPPDRP